MKIIERVLETLEIQEKTHYALAKNIGVDKSNIASWKRRKTDPPAKYIPSIALFLGVSEHWLYKKSFHCYYSLIFSGYYTTKMVGCHIEK